MRAGTLRVAIAAVAGTFSLTMASCGSSHHGGFVTNVSNVTTNTGTTDPHVQNALNVLNQSRAQFGAAPLTLDTNLNSCALRHAQDVASCSNFSLSGFAACAHNDFKAGDTCGANAENQGVASNVTISDEDSAFDSINASMMSEGPPPPGQDNHFLNITNPSYTKLGVGLFIDMNGNLWVSEEFK